MGGVRRLAGVVAGLVLAGMLAACGGVGESAAQTEFREAREAFESGEMTVDVWEPIVNSYVAGFSINSISGMSIRDFQVAYDNRWVRNEEFPELDMYEVVPRLTEDQAEELRVEMNFGDADGLMAMLEDFGVFDSSFFDTPQSPDDAVEGTGGGDTGAWSDWAETAYGTFDTVSESGSGYVQIDLPEEAGPGFVIDFEYSGPRAVLGSYLSSNDYDVHYSMAIYDEVSSGTVVAGLDYANSEADREDGDHYVVFIGATGEGDVGDWSITVRPIASLATYDSSSINPEISGSGPTVFVYDDGEPVSLSAAVEGQSQRIAVRMTTVPELGDADIGDWRGTSDSGSGAYWLDGGHMIIEVDADSTANWRLHVS